MRPAADPDIIPPTVDELRKQIAEQASGREPVPSIWVKAGQLFLIPAGIGAVCFFLYWFISWLTHEEEFSAPQLVSMIRTEGVRSRGFAAHQLSLLLQTDPAAAAEPGLAFLILDAYDQVSRDGLMQGEALAGLQYVLIHCVSHTRDARAVPRVVEVLDSDVSALVKTACMDVLGVLRGPEAAAAMARYIEDADPALRKFAVLNLAATGESGYADRLRARLEDDVTEVTWNAAIGLGWYHRDPAGAPVLRQMLDRSYIDQYTFGDPKQKEQRAEHAIMMACRAVAALNDATFVPSLEALANDDRSMLVREDARRALAELKAE